jgi:hypothetical protein
MLCASEGEGADGRGPPGRGRTGALAHERRRWRVGTSGQRENRSGNGSTRTKGDGSEVGRGRGRRGTRGRGLWAKVGPTEGRVFSFFFFNLFSSFISISISILIY